MSTLFNRERPRWRRPHIVRDQRLIPNLARMLVFFRAFRKIHTRCKAGGGPEWRPCDASGFPRPPGAAEAAERRLPQQAQPADGSRSCQGAICDPSRLPAGSSQRRQTARFKIGIK
jgi:hypothetical protein